MVDLVHRARLLRERFFNRVDLVAILAPWGKPCPVTVDGAEHLDAILLGHVDPAAPPVPVCYRKSNGGAGRGRFRVGSYCPAADGSTRWLCLDFDGAGHADALADPWGAALETFDAFTRAGLPSYLERSGGGKGWHLWCFFEPPIPAAEARAIGRGLAPRTAPLAAGGTADPLSGKGIEVFPKQDVIRGDELGNMVWLPWWSGAAEGGNLFCRRDGTPEEPPEGFATGTAEAVSRVLASLEPAGVAEPAPLQAPRVHAPLPGRSGGGLDAIRAAAQADPVRVAEALGLVRVGHRYLCPVCQPGAAAEHNAAMRINDAGFHCHKCGEQRDAIALVQAVEGADFPGAVTRLADLFGLPAGEALGRPRAPRVPRPAELRPVTPSAPPEVYGAFLDGCRPLPDPVLAWLGSKAISPEVAAWAGLRFFGRELPDLLEDLRSLFGAEAVQAAGLEALHVYHRAGVGVVVFPYRHEGRVVHVKARPPIGQAEAERLEVLRFIACGSCPVPFCVDLLERSPAGAEVMICEGETDTLAAVTAGMVAIGTPGTGAFKRAWVPLLRGRRVVVYFDADKAGRNGAASLAALLEQDGQPRPAPWRPLPEGMDLCDYLDAPGPASPPAADLEQDTAPALGSVAPVPGSVAPAVLAIREEWEERAAIMEHDGGFPRAEAEARAWECIRRAAWRRVAEQAREVPS